MTDTKKTPDNIIKNNEKFFNSLSKEERNYRQAKYRSNSFIKNMATFEDLQHIKELTEQRLKELS
ncbi:hypothetical protein [Oenococcus sicerae]|uniref:hypothetical protein n=1 Tax=Oenococcus sicerae TaxID=2203724 RepID=UPI0039EA157F